MNIEKLSKADKGLYVNAPRTRTCKSEDLERTTIQVPAALLRRIDKKTKGGKGICVAALLEFAMNTLDSNKEIIVIN